MQNLARLFVTSFIILLLWSPNSNAAVGVFIDGSQGSGEAEWDSIWDSLDMHTKSGAFGLVLDTAPTNERVFNYRMNIGFARQDLEDIDIATIETKGMYMENIFGFAFVQEENFRWWFGPLLRFGYYTGDTDTVQVAPGTSMKTELDYVEFGIGAVTGFNFKVGNAVLSPSVGVRFSGYGGEGKVITRDGFGTSSYYDDFSASATNVFANFAILF